ncbi:Down syndrome cell adhesion molecule homolog [Eumeta japonica]|uniref:Down syndrome cell adhesion molecule homolog n=1 Tax=Eumeta variegata TaxID=151549 RepID=A0A4C1SDG7_EUMVA|nr:Down syndrome cell adhesion molecule homolog [Eumeta japonica]
MTLGRRTGAVMLLTYNKTSSVHKAVHNLGARVKVAGDTDAAAASDSTRICKTAVLTPRVFDSVVVDGSNGYSWGRWRANESVKDLGSARIGAETTAQGKGVVPAGWDLRNESVARSTRARSFARLLVDDTVLSHTVRQLSVARVGSPVLLRCEMSSQLALFEVTWLLDGLPLPSGFSAPEFESSAFPLESKVLDYSITSTLVGVRRGRSSVGTALTQADLQASTCVVADVPSAAYKLATDDSSWVESGAELNALEARVGEAVVLPCLTGHVTAQAMTWQRQDANGEWNSITAADGTIRAGALVLTEVRPQHAGRYACAVSSDLSPRLLMRLVVHEPLSVTVSPNPLLSGTGGSGYFNCSVRGGRGAGVTLSWQHEGRSLHGTHTRFAVGPVRAHHAGVYQCTVHEHMDSAVGSSELILAEIGHFSLVKIDFGLARQIGDPNYGCIG